MQEFKLDMSSNEAHITNECPNCNCTWMCKVEPKGNCPKCKARYEMETLETGEVEITYYL